MNNKPERELEEGLGEEGYRSLLWYKGLLYGFMLGSVVKMQVSNLILLLIRDVQTFRYNY